MNWRSYLQSRTRRPLFLWRMVIGILTAGVAAGVAIDWALPGAFRGELAAVEESTQGGSAWDELDRLAEMGEWGAVWRGIPRVIVARWGGGWLTALAVLTGVCWLSFSLQAVQIRTRRDIRLWALLAGMALGVLSVWPTMFLAVWQEVRWGLVESPELANGLRENILGVGLREEAAKLACFLPLLPFLVRARDELAALVAAGCVGLGFAMEENVAYIAASSGTATLTRMLTPAPLHMAMTGVIGLAAYRACRWPKEWGPQFLAVFGVVVLGHGLYDAFLSLPRLVEYAIAADIVFILLIYQFFRELRPLRAVWREPVSLTANFLFCVSVVAAATFVYLVGAIGLRPAMDAMAMGVLGQAVMVYMFLREMPETMVTV
jgi:RsiW-degrading membrane proteinase PrsW (M82 family)